MQKIKMLAGKLIVLALIAVTVIVFLQKTSLNEVQARSMLQTAAPSIESSRWLNSSPLTNKDLAGKVYLVEFWTFGCYNCVNVEPYIKQWYQRYKDKGFEVIAVHSPEFSHEKNIDNVKAYINRKNITYPVAIDNEFTIWKRYSNRYWPAMYLVDKKGKLRYYHFGEGNYAKTESMIKTLLAEK